jgi:hypothetical protein
VTNAGSLRIFTVDLTNLCANRVNDQAFNESLDPNLNLLNSFTLSQPIYLNPPIPRSADHNGMKRLRPLELWDRGFESHSRHECLGLFCVCVVLCR